MFIFDTMPQLSATYKNERCTSVYAPLFKNDYIDDVNAHHTVQSRRQPYGVRTCVCTLRSSIPPQCLTHS